MRGAAYGHKAMKANRMCTQACSSGGMELAHPGCESGLLALLPGSVFSGITLEASYWPPCLLLYTRMVRRVRVLLLFSRGLWMSPP